MAASIAIGMSSRSRLLTNSAAEFIENRADTALGPDVADTSPEFVPELDRFAANDEIPREDYYKESREHVKQFKATLAAFQKNLVDRKLDKRFDIDIKDATEYTLKDVLKIAQVVEQSHKDADKVHTCMGRIRKFFRASGRNASTFKRLLAFVPEDSYGSIICGGFTVILGTLERLDTLRNDIYAALGNIPKIMRKIHDLLDVHFKSERLKFCADSVLVSIFTLLELIIRELSGNVGKKVIKSFKGDRYGASIDEAIQGLEESVKEFETEARICDAHRLGQIDKITKGTHARTQNIEFGVQKLAEGLTGSFQEFQTQLKLDKEAVEQKQLQLLAQSDQVLQKLSEKELVRKEVVTEEHGVQVHNYFYYFLASNLLFDNRTGKLNEYQADKRLLNSKEFSEDNKATVANWLTASGKPHRVAAGDLLECFQTLDAGPERPEQDRAMHILMAGELRDWLRSTTSKLLLVEIRTDRDQYFSAASYASTMLVRAIQKIGTFPVLYHYCVPRAMDPKQDGLSGGAGMLVSLIAQLLGYLQRGPDVNLQFMRSRKRQFDKIKYDVKRLLHVFKELVKLLSGDKCLYIVIDSVWKLQLGTDDDAEAVIGLLKLIRKENLFMKIFITDPFSDDLADVVDPRPDRESGDIARKAIRIYVPEHVEPGIHGINTSWVEMEMADIVEECSSSSSEGSSGSDDKQVEKPHREKRHRSRERSRGENKGGWRRGKDESTSEEESEPE